MFVDVHDLLGEVGERKEYELDLSIPVEYGDATAAGKVELIGAEEGVIGRFVVKANVPERCSRCLRAMTRAFEKRFTIDELAIIDGKTDLSLPIREEIVASEPIAALHNENCKGLCPVCGKDRNEVDCGHGVVVERESFKPLAALKNLVKRKKS